MFMIRTLFGSEWVKGSENLDSSLFWLFIVIRIPNVYIFIKTSKKEGSLKASEKILRIEVIAVAISFIALGVLWLQVNKIM